MYDVKDAITNKINVKFIPSDRYQAELEFYFKYAFMGDIFVR